MQVVLLCRRHCVALLLCRRHCVTLLLCRRHCVALLLCCRHCAALLLKKKEEEGLQGVFKRLRRNGHQLEKGCCEQLSSDCHSKGGVVAMLQALCDGGSHEAHASTNAVHAMQPSCAACSACSSCTRHWAIFVTVVTLLLLYYCYSNCCYASSTDVLHCCVWCSRGLCSPILGKSFDQGCSRILAGGLGAATVGRYATGDCTQQQRR
jgi:hypothetical protein